MIDLVVEALTLNLQYIPAASMYSQLVLLPPPPHPPRAEAATPAASGGAPRYVMLRLA